MGRRLPPWLPWRGNFPAGTLTLALGMSGNLEATDDVYPVKGIIGNVLAAERVLDGPLVMLRKIASRTTSS